MGRQAWFAIVVIALMQTASACAQNCHLTQLASFDIADGGVIVIPVRINGSDQKFLVDTGGVMSSVSPAVVEKLDLWSRPIVSGAEFYLADGTLLDHYALVKELGLGIVKARYVRLIVQPQQSKVGIEDFDGTLAPDFLPNFDLDLDFGHNKLNLISPEHCEGKVVYWADAFTEIPFEKDLANHIVVSVTLDGVNTVAMIDTGASQTSISEYFARSHFRFMEDTAKLPPPEADDGFLVHYVGRFGTLNLKGVAVNNPGIDIVPDEMAESYLKRHGYGKDIEGTNALLQSPPIVIGMNVLRKLHVYISYKENKLYITGADAARTPPQPSATPPTATPPAVASSSTTSPAAKPPAAAQIAPPPPATPAAAP